MFSEKINDVLARMQNDDQLRRAYLSNLKKLTEFYVNDRVERIDEGREHSKMYATMFCRPCPRQGAFSFHGVEEAEERNPRFLMNMQGGNQYENIILAALMLLFPLEIQPYKHITDWTYDGDKHPSVVADAIATLNDEQMAEFEAEFGVHPRDSRVVIEIKSAGEASYKKMRDTGLNEGYYAQATLEMHANDCDTTIVIVVDRSKGYVEDFIVQYDKHSFGALQDLFYVIRDSETPFSVRVPHHVVPEMKYKAGKKAWNGPSDSTHQPRHNQKGNIYGWDLPTGNDIIPNWPCGYCGHRETCWDQQGYSIEVEINGGRPVWVATPKKEQF